MFVVKSIGVLQNDASDLTLAMPALSRALFAEILKKR